MRVLIANYEIPPQDMGPLPFPDNLFTIPGIATFRILDGRTVTYEDNNGYDLTVNGLPGKSRPYRVKRYRLDANNDLTPVSDTVRRGGPVHLTATLPAPSVELVVVRPLNGG